MKAINTRYGASVELTTNSDDITADTATLYVGLAGELLKITKTVSFVAGVADLSLLPAETEIPLGSYKYQIDVSFTDGRLKKFPEPLKCNSDLPDFIISESLGDTEVVS